MRHTVKLGIGLALLSAACSDDARRTTGPALPAPGLKPDFAITASTHPAGNIAGTDTLRGRPFGLDISSSDVVYITRVDSARLKRVNLPSFAFAGDVAVGSAPSAVAFHPAGNTAWVTNQLSHTVGVINVATNTQVRTIAIGGDPFVLAVKPDGGTIYVSNNNGKVFAFNAVTDQPVDTFSFTSPVNGLAFHPDGVRLYASQLSNGTVSEINTQTGTIARNFVIGGTTLQGVVVSKDGSELYVADEGANVLRVVSVASGTQTATVALGGGGFSVALSPDNVQLYVSLPASGVVKVIDRATRAIAKTIQTNGTPRRLAFSAAGETAAIANEAGWVDFVR
jgi:YVTN family beta-propeller protein